MDTSAVCLLGAEGKIMSHLSISTPITTGGTCLAFLTPNKLKINAIKAYPIVSFCQMLCDFVIVYKLLQAACDNVMHVCETCMHSISVPT